MSDKIEFMNFKLQLENFIASRDIKYISERIENGCFVYGAGGYGQRILALLTANGINCCGMIDRRFENRSEVFKGVLGIHPSDFEASMAVGKCLIVGIHNHLISPETILEFADQFEFHDILWNADLPDLFGHAADNYWLTNRRFTIEHLERAYNAKELLADEESRNLFNEILKFRVTGLSTPAMKSDLEHQYFPSGLITFDRPISFVDGGAYTGDTFRALVANNIMIDQWIAFEPDPNNFSALARTASELKAKATLLPCGLSDKFNYISFQTNEGAASHLDDSSGGLKIPCVSLDEVFQGIKVDYIKLDIEGAEINALNGMAKIIKRDQPCLAVSAYHQPDHLWLVLETLAGLAPYANLHIRQHGENGFDTVVYAIGR